MTQLAASILGLDIGTKRIGVAKAYWPNGIAYPLTTLTNDEDFMFRLEEIIQQYNIKALIAGKPRNLNGQETEQTAYCVDFAEQIKNETQLPVYLEDEALTSVDAEQELKDRGVAYSREDIDALSAAHILDSFISSHSKGVNIG